MLEKIEKMRENLRLFRPSRETEVIHFLLFFAGASVGIIVLAYLISALHFSNAPPPDFFWEVHPWRPEAGESTLYFIGIFLIPGIAFIVLATWLFLLNLIVGKVSSDKERLSWAAIFSLGILIFSIFLLFLFIYFLAKGILNKHALFIIVISAVSFGYAGLFLLFKKIASKPGLFYASTGKFPVFFKRRTAVFLMLTALFAAIAVSLFLYESSFVYVYWHKFAARFSSAAYSVILGLLFSGAVVYAVCLAVRFRARLSFRVPVWAELVLVFGGIFLLLFNPVYKYEIGYLTESAAIHHYNFFLGPVNDVFHGKTLMVDSTSFYGILSIYGLSALFKYAVNFSYANAYLFFMLVAIFYYFLLYLFLRMFFKERIYAVLGIFFIAAINAVAGDMNYPPQEYYTWANITPFRYFFDVPVFMLLLSYLRNPKLRYLYPASFLAGWAFFHNLEKGIALLVAVFVFFALKFFFFNENFFKAARALLRELAVILGTLFFFFLAISAFTYFRAWQFPDWLSLTVTSRIFSSGYAAQVLPVAGFYYLVLAAYFIFITVALVELYFGVLGEKAVLGGIIAVYGIITFFYYIVRSQQVNIFQLTIPSALLFIIILRHFCRNVSYIFKDALFLQPKGREPWKIYYLAGFFSVLAILFAVWFQYLGAVKYLMTKRYFSMKPEVLILSYNRTGFADMGRPPDFPAYRTLSGEKDYRYPDASEMFRVSEYIKGAVPPEGRVALLSKFDTQLLIISDRANLLNIYNTEQILTKTQLRFLQDQLRREMPKFIFIDADRDGIEWAGTYFIRSLFSALKDKYALYDKIDFMEVYRRKD